MAEADRRNFNAGFVTDLNAAAKKLKEGKVIGIPTDSVYALAASVNHPESVRKIFEIKKRPLETAVTLLLPDKETLENAKPNFHPVLMAFIKPCPYGFVVPKGDWLKKICPEETIKLLGDKDSVCIRITNSTPLCLFCLKSGPLVISSANKHKEPDSTHHDMVERAFGDAIDGVVKAGNSLLKKSSSIVNCLDIQNDRISYFRIGSTSQDDIFRDYRAAKESVRTLTNK
ncbi:threonylcarbamoyl-AMP synthase-like isoform X2 [Physella acuta]|nr:threonylcarbamoyl-AMP synthase-like isoform X2 [Physella acuta]